MMKRSEQVVGFTGAAPVLQRARAALLVYALAVKSVASRIATARPAPTSQQMQRPEYLWP